MKVIKRDGRKVQYDSSKIYNAIEKAFISVYGHELSVENLDKIDEVTEQVDCLVRDKGKKEIDIEDIQDLVEGALMSDRFDEVAKEYIIYRNERTKLRTRNSKLRQLILEKAKAENVQNQNANMDEHSFGGRIGEAAAITSKDIALNDIMSRMASYNHTHNIIYTHDLDHYIYGDHNCDSVPIDKLLANGFNTRQTDIRPARSINTAFQLLAVIFQIQSLQQFGGVSATHLDHSMVPYFRLSLRKHYILEYVKRSDDFMSMDLLEMTEDEVDDWIDNHKEEYFKKFNLSDKDFYLGNDNPNIDKELWQAALFETRIELFQAVEGMYHNLNSLQSRSGGVAH